MNKIRCILNFFFWLIVNICTKEWMIAWSQHYCLWHYNPFQHSFITNYWQDQCANYKEFQICPRLITLSKESIQPQTEDLGENRLFVCICTPV